MEETVAAKGWLVAFFEFDGDRIKLSRHSHQFPIGDFDTALDLLDGNLRQAAVTDSISR